MKRIGLQNTLSRYYWRARFHTSSQRINHTIAGIEAAFLTQTFQEYTRFQTLAGERLILEEVISALDQQDIFYDIGANVGTYSCFAASKLGPDAVVAFEPEPKNNSRLRENLALNDLDANLQEVALSDSDGSVELALAGGEAGEGEHAISTNEVTDTLEVPMAKGDSIIDRNDLPSPTVVKIDVEGAEMAVLRGLENTLQESVRLIYVEVHPGKLPDFGDSASDVREYLKGAGFAVTEISERGDEVFLRGAI